ncbi:MAG: YIP1 family protein [Thioclava sp.]|nr:YIP1 family protein [Thioclava sp.]MBD3802663.1 YIP1 family protein [Thioclava sp.]
MQVDPKDWLMRSFTEPRAVARELMALNLPNSARFQAMVLVVVMSAILGTLAQMVFTVITKLDLGELTSPLMVVGLQASLLLYGAFAMSFVGQRAGGKGSYPDALLLLTWIEFVLMIGQVIQVVLMVFFPISATIMSLLLVGLMFFLLVQFTMELHGFTNPLAVAVGVILTFLGSALIAGIVLVSTGLVQMPTTPMPS